MLTKRCALISIVTAQLAAGLSVAQPTSSERSALQAEIARMIVVLGWPRMVDITLQRGDLQRVAASKLQTKTPEGLQCINQKYTQRRVLDEIAKGYERVYSDPAIVAEISRFYSHPGGKRIQEQVASRAPAVGAQAAYEGSKDSHWNLLTPEEKRAFTEFGSSPAGRAYVEGRPLQLKVHSEMLLALAARIAGECSQ
jgi:hypothetical protein